MGEILPAIFLLSIALTCLLYVVVSSSRETQSLGVSLFRTAPSITILFLVWSSSKGSRKYGGYHEANDRSSGNGCTFSGLSYSFTDHGFGSDRSAVVQVLFLSSLTVSFRL